MKIPTIGFFSTYYKSWENGQDDCCWTSDMHETKKKLILGNLQNFFGVDWDW
jgi:hypothetical protein